MIYVPEIAKSHTDPLFHVTKAKPKLTIRKMLEKSGNPFNVPARQLIRLLRNLKTWTQVLTANPPMVTAASPNIMAKYVLISSKGSKI